MSSTSLRHQGNPLSEPLQQLAILETTERNQCVPFHETLASHGLPDLRSGSIETLQINVGKLCNQVCRHCHVDAGPDRREIMSRETLQHCLDVITRHEIQTIDLTGGAPEMNPHFRWFVQELRKLGRRIIDRCNLTILSAQGFTDLPEFLAENSVEVVASLPCYLEENCDAQRGDGVFQKSIDGLRRLNELGYGKPETGLILSLVYNPVGPSLPPNQDKLEAAYREQLATRFGIAFTQLYTITNLPISRFLDDLMQSGRYGEYMEKLLAAFNPETTSRLMCRTTLSVDWQGFLYDCDFNQMLDLKVRGNGPRHISQFDAASLHDRLIVTGRHCYGCTAGAGSSCQGALA
ncbi:MAG: arsenosugar biosynthesis radical SAM protein ArsS [Planctomycetaceae bacterium]|nr:arsenosugar biosynthesis radical SAM protein ArsS [Planctomycetaceae bacterium]MCB9951232.1 arsenosugar biosynthesis radical SAM protein ArsS [Planctomycetaceae bacterium]